jgi:hypothetical protein
MSGRRALLASASLVLVVVLGGCGIFGRSSSRDDRFVRANAPRTSPSGGFTASIQSGPVQNGVETSVVVITDGSGKEVFHDSYAYSNRHGVGVTWLSTKDQLWILSSDVGPAYVEQNAGTWVKTAITPDTTSSIPTEIADLQ